MRELLPAYKSILHVRAGNGEYTFWHDRCLGNQTLFEAFPSLHSHFIKVDALVRDVLSGDLDTMLQPQLSRQAEDEMERL